MISPHWLAESKEQVMAFDGLKTSMILLSDHSPSLNLADARRLASRYDRLLWSGFHYLSDRVHERCENTIKIFTCNFSVEKGWTLSRETIFISYLRFLLLMALWSVSFYFFGWLLRESTDVIEYSIEHRESHQGWMSSVEPVKSSYTSRLWIWSNFQVLWIFEKSRQLPIV